MAGAKPIASLNCRCSAGITYPCPGSDYCGSLCTRLRKKMWDATGADLPDLIAPQPIAAANQNVPAAV